MFPNRCTALYQVLAPLSTIKGVGMSQAYHGEGSNHGYLRKPKKVGYRHEVLWRLYSSMAEGQACKLKVLGTIPQWRLFENTL